jgi:7-cyano-7-deazaguanine synthase
MVESALTHDGDVNKKHRKKKNLPGSYVPNRNAFFITIAHAFAQKIDADILVTGVGEEDYSGYPDCRQGFINKIQDALNTGSEMDIVIETPLMNMKKWEIFRLAQEEDVLNLVLKESHTCYNGIKKINEWGRGCGKCPACNLRKNGWEEFKKWREKNG